MVLTASVVLPLYNKAHTIARAINSVLAQQQEAIDIVVVDDGSTDSSASIVEAEFGDRVRLIRQRNQGPGVARNVGARAARGDVLAFLDADDEWLPGFLATGLKALQAHPEAVAYACSYDTGAYAKYVPDKVSLITDRAVVLPSPPWDTTPNMLRNYLNGLHSSSSLVRRGAFDAAGGYFDRERCLWGEDSYLWGQILFSGPVFWDPSVLARYHIEDSDLGFAVKYRHKSRPLVSCCDELLERITIDRRRAFMQLVRCLAEDDSHSLVQSGHLLKGLQLQHRHGLLDMARLAFDLRLVVRYLRREWLQAHKQ